MKLSRLLLYAPGVHAGGGFVLLKALLTSPSLPPIIAFLDERAKEKLQITSDKAETLWCEPTAVGRFRSEFRLRSMVKSGDILLCFHGLPPIFRSRAHVAVFLQNRLIIESQGKMRTEGKVRLNIFIKRMLFRVMRYHVDEYIVQTPSMSDVLSQWVGGTIPITVFPFIDGVMYKTEPTEYTQKKYDFIYVADGVAHKNHRHLISAWIRLAQEGLKPSLLLTLGERDRFLLDEIEDAKASFDLLIYNAGAIEREGIFDLYRSSKALIFPSYCESFGIPLIEAKGLGLPIIASELDFVRDVCMPCETFDPASPVSITRAVKRFLGVPDSTVQLRNADEFIKELLG